MTDHFLTGVNYWASHAGTEMWQCWDEAVVRRDLSLLKDYGIRVLRVFPNWRDFQPVKAMLTAGHAQYEYRMADGTWPENAYFLSEIMLDRFQSFCRCAQEAGFQLIVGLVTGWMSGRLFVPPALEEKNIYSDSTALMFQQLFVRGFVERMKDEPSIIAWDLGNECNCMDKALSREAAFSWAAAIVNAIKACDPVRPVYSGMHSLEIQGKWKLQDQGMLTDMLTTHPYPLWVEHCDEASVDAYRTLMHATAQTQYYANVGGKPCMVEEIGTMGPMICDETIAAGFMNVNLWSNWAHGATGLLWWCAFDQNLLTAPPYDWNMCERELGLFTDAGQPKSEALAMRDFAQCQKELNIQLPQHQTEGVLLLSRDQDHWGLVFATYTLAKQAGLTLNIAWCEDGIPDCSLYYLPSIRSHHVMSKRSYDALKQKVRDGATLYISYNDGFLTEFEELTGLQVTRSERRADNGKALYQGHELPFGRDYRLELKSTSAEIIAYDEQNLPFITKHAYGKGTVWFVNAPVEENVLSNSGNEISAWRHIYRSVAEGAGVKQALRSDNPRVGLTLHENMTKRYAVAINYSSETQPLQLIKTNDHCHIDVLYGNGEYLQPYGVTILEY